MISKFLHLLKQPYPLNIEFSKSFWGILVTSIFIPLFLIVFQPFGLHENTSSGKTWILLSYGPLTFTFLCFNFYGLTKLFPRIFDEEKWLVWKESAWILWLVFMGGLLCISYHYITPLRTASFPELFTALLQGFFVAMIPETLYVLSTYNAFLKNRIRQAEKVNQGLRDQSALQEKQQLTLASETGKDVIEIELSELLFIQSIDNYSNIVKQENDFLKKMLLRSSLKKLEDQIHTPHIMRCHRSFIVNLAKVQAVNGNARGYKLFLRNVPTPIPVARDSSKAVLDALTELSGNQPEYSRRSA